MRKKLLVLLAAGVMAMPALSAFATPEVATVSASARGSVSGFATLATWGTFEMELAPVYTRVAALRHRAAAQLEARRIPVGVAIEIQARADHARSRLDTARRAGIEEATPAQRQMLAEATRLLEQAEKLLER